MASAHHHDVTVIFEGPSECCGDLHAWCRRTKWKITDQYVERQYGICCIEVDNLQLIRIRDISYRSGTCCCGACGVIHIVSSDQTDPDLLISGIPDGKTVYAKIRDAWDKASSGARINITET